MKKQRTAVSFTIVRRCNGCEDCENYEDCDDCDDCDDALLCCLFYLI